MLSDANKWTYTWSDLPKYSTAEKEVAYSAHVTSTLVDYTAATTEMTIEMTYVQQHNDIRFRYLGGWGRCRCLRPET